MRIGPLRFQAGCCKRWLNLALVFLCLFCVILGFWYFVCLSILGVIFILCCQYHCSWLPGETVLKMTHYVSRGTLSTCLLSHLVSAISVFFLYLFQKRTSAVKRNGFFMVRMPFRHRFSRVTYDNGSETNIFGIAPTLICLFTAELYFRGHRCNYMLLMQSDIF